MHRIIDFYIRALEYDGHVFSQPWIYWCLLIPASCYLGFFLLKWAALTAPLWLPVTIITESIKEGRMRRRQRESWSRTQQSLHHVAASYRASDAWSDHPLFPRAEWRQEVMLCHTQAGYWDWLSSQLEQRDHENK